MSTFFDSLTEFSYASSERGRSYFLEDRVNIVDFSNYECVAEVLGSGKNVYTSKLKFNKKYRLISNSCSCPVGYFCKHVAATLFALDAMAETNSLSLDEERLEGPKSDWRVEVDKIFVKYFASRYRFTPNYGALNAFLLNNEYLFLKEKIDALTYITKRLYEYYSSFYYDLFAINKFLESIYDRYLSKEEYIALLETLKKDDKKNFYLLFGGLFNFKSYIAENNKYLSSLIEKEEIKELFDGKANALNVNNLTVDNFIYLAKYYPKIFIIYNLRDFYYNLNKEEIDDEIKAAKLYASLLALINVNSAPPYIDETTINKIKAYAPLLAKDIAFRIFFNLRTSRNFAYYLSSYKGEEIPSEHIELLKKIKNKPFYLSIFLHLPPSFEEIELSDVVDLLEIPDFFVGYESYLTKLAVNKINHGKKLKNFDIEIELGLVVLDHFHYENIISLLVDKAIQDKMLENDSNVYLYLLHKYALLETIGFKKYVLPSE